MARRFGLFGACLVSSLCVLLLLASHQLSSFGQRQAPEFGRSIQSYADSPQELQQAAGAWQQAGAGAQGVAGNVSMPSIGDVIAQQHAILEQELGNYQFPADSSVANYTPAMGGRPLRNIIVTTWRSGSTFLGDVINAVPGNYYHYEPLLDYDIMQIRGPPHAAGALATLKKLLTCDYSGLAHYLQYGRAHVYLFTHNGRLWDQCQLHPQHCWNASFLGPFCRLFPFQSMKLVRLRLRLAEELLRDPALDVRVLLLVRDPRGTLQSRRHRNWCPGQPDCDQPALLCADMVSDFNAAVRLHRLYPNRFRTLRYEDFSLDPYSGVRDLFAFFRLHLHPSVVDFLDSHTKLDAGGVSSTFRNSKSAPFHWKQDLNFSDIQHIEQQCRQAMRYWGYVPAGRQAHLKDLDPLTGYSLD